MLAIIGAVFLTLIGLGLSYVVFAFTVVSLGFSDMRTASRLLFVIVSASIVAGICFGWWLLVGTHINVSFG
jgi:hypothetical protein